MFAEGPYAEAVKRGEEPQAPCSTNVSRQGGVGQQIFSTGRVFFVESRLIAQGKPYGLLRKP
jgi:hypothetical protein